MSEKQQNYRFRFKQFGINDSSCAMKIGTDGVLLGAWADVESSHNILDIGSGSGLISLMVAQRSNATVIGIEIDSNAAIQSIENINNTPWKERLTIINSDFTNWASTQQCQFDHIVSNPPFFSSGPKAPTTARATARHENSLTYEFLIKSASQLLTKDGKLSIISPFDRKDDIIFCCELFQLYISRITLVSSKPNCTPNRILWEICRQKQISSHTHLFIRTENNGYSEDYINLTKDFYLNF